MPLYEYQCDSCGETFERRRSFSDTDDDVECPKCGADHPKRRVSKFLGGPSPDNSCVPSGGG